MNESLLEKAKQYVKEDVKEREYEHDYIRSGTYLFKLLLFTPDDVFLRENLLEIKGLKIPENLYPYSSICTIDDNMLELATLASEKRAEITLKKSEDIFMKFYLESSNSMYANFSKGELVMITNDKGIENAIMRYIVDNTGSFFDSVNPKKNVYMRMDYEKGKHCKISTEVYGTIPFIDKDFVKLAKLPRLSSCGEEIHRVLTDSLK